jgi:hypothetical protein
MGAGEGKPGICLYTDIFKKSHRKMKEIYHTVMQIFETVF